jgi:hypothetical protein
MAPLPLWDCAHYACSLRTLAGAASPSTLSRSTASPPLCSPTNAHSHPYSHPYYSLPLSHRQLPGVKRTTSPPTRQPTHLPLLTVTPTATLLQLSLRLSIVGSTSGRTPTHCADVSSSGQLVIPDGITIPLLSLPDAIP